ncbi:hypothetical protein SAMN04488104_100964 [Algoriphagus faecimaris]|uniref:PH domain-containing protein n=1 Tax=Algoriphagus faecimaris TaxID=686796 RepID=A0A1G6QJ97_9BACT|nr:hypothetical protein [Algoriphagus faecimaris]SDC91747.1 hypothetical protein SAMN04488104_100964 [Algoriphagus faecimaris]
MVVNEVQSFRGTWLMYVVILLELPGLVLILTFYYLDKLGDDGWIPLLIMIVVIGGTILLIASLRLETRMDSFSFSYRNPPFLNRWRKLNPEEILSIHVEKKDGILDHGGYGIRFGRKKTGFIYFADHIIQVVTPKKTLVFTTRKADAFQQLIDQWKPENNNPL